MPATKGSLSLTEPVKGKQMEHVELKKFGDLTDTPFPILLEEERKAVSVSSKLRTLLSEITQMKVELVMFLYIISTSIRRVSTTTLVMDKVCLAHLNYSVTICSNISYYPDIKSDVVKLANNYNLGLTFLTFLPSSILTCFIGSWSDKYSRKIPIIVAVSGLIIEDIGTTLCAVFMQSRVEFMYLSAIFNGFSGGFMVVLTVLYSYVSDISTVSNRTMKFTLLQASFGFAMPLGIIMGGHIYKFYGYITVFLTATIGHLISLMFIIIALKETKGLDNKEPWAVKFRKLWTTDTVVESFKATVRKRPNQGKKQILLLLGCMSLMSLHKAASGTIEYAYTHHRYNWDNTKYSTISGIFSLIGSASILFIVPLFKRAKLGDSVLGIVGSTSMLLQDVALGLASNEYIYYAANSVGIMDSLLSLASRARISKVVARNETGKIFSFMSTAQTFIPVIASIAISQVLNATLNFFPGLIFLVFATMSVIPIGVFIWITRLPKMEEDEKDGVTSRVEEDKSVETAKDNDS